MSIETNPNYILEQIKDNWPPTCELHIESAMDILEFVEYGHFVLSQFGMGLKGHSIRQRNGSYLLTVKVAEEGVPLVGFVTGHTPTGCISKFLDLLEKSEIKWAKDKYPVI